MSGLHVAEHAADKGLVSLRDQGALAQVPLTLGALLGEDVPGVRLVAADLATASQSKALCGTAMGLELRHGSSFVLRAICPNGRRPGRLVVGRHGRD